MTEFWPAYFPGMLGYDPDDAFLLALGRLTWSAIVVEDEAYEITGVVLHSDERGRQIGSSIGDTVKRLSKASRAKPIDACLNWLVECGAALEARNSVLHGVVRMRIDNDAEGRFRGPVLSHRPRKSTEYNDRPLTTAEMGSIAATLTSLVNRWDDVWRDLAEYLITTAKSAVAAGRCRGTVDQCLACDAIGIDCD